MAAAASTADLNVGADAGQAAVAEEATAVDEDEADAWREIVVEILSWKAVFHWVVAAAATGYKFGKTVSPYHDMYNPS